MSVTTSFCCAIEREANDAAKEEAKSLLNFGISGVDLTTSSIGAGATGASDATCSSTAHTLPPQRKRLAEWYLLEALPVLRVQFRPPAFAASP